MSIEQDSSAAKDPDIHLQPVTFITKQDNGLQAVYQGDIGDIAVPDQPLLQLTVTLASPAGDILVAEEIDDFLSSIRAGFVVTEPKPNGRQGDDQNTDPFDVDSGVLFQAELIRPDPSKVDVGVIVRVQSSVQRFPWWVSLLIVIVGFVLEVLSWLTGGRVRWVAHTKKKGSLSLTKSATYYPPIAGQEISANVVSTYGQASVWPKGGTINAGEGVPSKGVKVIVTATSSKCRYTITY
jgi:hypothetical protein